MDAKRSNSANNFHRRQILEKLDKLEKIEKDIITIKEMIIELNSNIIKMDKKIPKRTAGWIMGEYKTYED